MKKYIIGLIVLALLGGGAYLYLGRGAADVAAPQTAQAAPAVEASNQTIAEAKVVPIRSAALSLASGGMVAEVLVKEGDQVKAGQVLARLDDADLKLNLEQARVDLKQARADEQALVKGATPEQIAAAKARIAQAQGQYQQAAGSVTKADIAAARANLAAAKARLAALDAGHTDARTAELALQQAQTQLQARRDQLSAAKTDAQLQMEQRVHDLTGAQSAYATAKHNWEYVQESGRDPSLVTINPQSGKKSHLKLDDKQKQQYHDAYVQAEAAMHSAEAAVRQAQVDYDAARQAEASGIQAAEQDVAGTQDQLDELRAGGDSQQLATARAQVAGAQAELNRLTGASRSGDLEAAQAGVAITEAELARITADPDAGELARAEAAIARAELAIKQAQRAIDLATLTAPFAGTIASLDLKVREYIAPGAPVVQLADINGWQIETADLTELNVVSVHEGDAVTVTFDAIPELKLPGTVSRIKGFGENRQGDITYKVVVAPDQQDARLRWNMTATVSIARR
ncbi:MAG: HlyD family secretion protein [Roseiflexaceae bacterium]